MQKTTHNTTQDYVSRERKLQMDAKTAFIPSINMFVNDARTALSLQRKQPDLTHKSAFKSHIFFEPRYFNAQERGWKLFMTTRDFSYIIAPELQLIITDTLKRVYAVMYMYICIKERDYGKTINKRYYLSETEYLTIDIKPGYFNTVSYVNMYVELYKKNNSAFEFAFPDARYLIELKVNFYSNPIAIVYDFTKDTMDQVTIAVSGTDMRMTF